MKVLFLHQSFPAQFLNLATYMGRDPRYEAVFITERQEDTIPGVKKLISPSFRESSPKTHCYIQSLEQAVLRGQSVYRTASALKAEGFTPDVIFGHSGWGSTLFMKELFPHAKLLCYFEWFFHSKGTDKGFEASSALDLDGALNLRTANASCLFDLYNCDAGVSPMHWQRQQFPAEYQKKIKVLHDGIRTGAYAPRPGAKLLLPDKGLDLSEVSELVTYVGRGMESYRGFPQFMEALDILLRRRPNCHAVIVGTDRICYGGAKPPGGKTYKEWMLERLPGLDLSRVHFTGQLRRLEYLQVLQASHVHVYLTYPFVLSWSMLEAMSVGCLLVASSTPPVTEVIEDGVNGLLVDFFSPEAIARKVEEALEERERMASIRNQARNTIIERYDIERILPQQLKLLEELAEG